VDGLAPGRTARDLGAGTGKFTGQLVRTGARVIAVEPIAEMRAKIEQLAGVCVLSGAAESIPLPDSAVDAVLCAQAFHWFATSAALAEIRRALRPGGILGLVWNVRDERVDWVAALSRIMAPYEGGAPRFHSGAWRRAFPAVGFGELIGAEFQHEHVGPPERVIVDRVLSVSFIAALPVADREQVAAAVRHLITSHPDLAGRDVVTYPYRTLAFSCRRAA
jgi:SAM-dependent methyltransferase